MLGQLRNVLHGRVPHVDHVLQNPDLLVQVQHLDLVRVLVGEALPEVLQHQLPELEELLVRQLLQNDVRVADRLLDQGVQFGLAEQEAGLLSPGFQEGVGQGVRGVLPVR